MKRIATATALGLLAALAIAAPANAQAPIEVIDAASSELCEDGCLVEDMTGTFELNQGTGFPITCNATFDLRIWSDGSSFPGVDGSFQLENISLTGDYQMNNCYGPSAIGSACRDGGFGGPVTPWPGAIEGANSQDSFYGEMSICYGNGYHEDVSVEFLESAPSELHLWIAPFDDVYGGQGGFDGMTYNSTIDILSTE